MSTKQKQPKAKKAGKARKTQKPVAPATTEKASPTRERDPRLPAAGTVLTRMYKGKEHRLKVLADGFEYEGEKYRSLTAAAKRATGYPSIAGTDWWGVSKREPAAPKGAAPKRKRKPAPADAAPEPAPAAESATA